MENSSEEEEEAIVVIDEHKSNPSGTSWEQLEFVNKLSPVLIYFIKFKSYATPYSLSLHLKIRKLNTTKQISYSEERREGVNLRHTHSQTWQTDS